MPASRPHPDLDWTSYGYALGQRVREVRTTVGLTQEALAHRADIARNQVQNVENNRNNDGGPGNPTMQTLYRLAQGMGVPVVALLPSIDVTPPRTADTRPDVTFGTTLQVALEPLLHAARDAIAAESHR